MNWYGAALEQVFRVFATTVLVMGVVGGCSQPEGSTDPQQPVATPDSSVDSSSVDSSNADSEADDSPVQVPAATPLATSETPGQLATMAPDDSPVLGQAESGSETGYESDASSTVTDTADDPSERAASVSVESEVEVTSTDDEAAPLALPLKQPADPVAPVAHQSAKQTASKIAREPLFVGWPKPRVALVITGRQYGYLEPCGCSGLENQNGGLVRRSTLLQQLTDKGWPVVPIDAGNQVRRFGRQAEIKFQITIEGLGSMGYRAIALGPDDLRLPAPELIGVITNIGIEPNPFVAANVSVIDPSFTSSFLVIEQGGKKIGVTAILGDRNQKLVQNGDVTLRPAEEGIAEVWPELQAARCDFYMLIAHATTEESIALGQKFPQFKVVVTTGGAGEPTLQPEKIKGTESLLVEAGTKGMFAGVVALFDDPAMPLRYQRIPLDARFPDSEKMLQLLAAYQDQLKAAGFDGLGIKPLPFPGGREFVGSEACQDCHGKAYRIWKEGRDDHEPRHAHAYATLQNPPKRSKIPRNFDPECISCHVVGWNPQKYYPYVSGFMNLEDTPELIDVGCENCHGPGARHVAVENGDIDVEEDEQEALRKLQVLKLEDAEQKCLECHDLDNSPDFQEEGAFQRYWEKIRH